MSQEINLHATTDATIWTDEFLRVVAENPSIPNDRETMIGWFANAIMCGYDHGRAAGEKLTKQIENSPREANNGGQ